MNRILKSSALQLSRLGRATVIRCSVFGTLLATFMGVGVAGSVSRPEDRQFELVAPTELSFNYPNPPREGEDGYFNIAVKGRPRCVIVHSDDATPAVRRAVLALQSYLGIAVGERPAVISEDRRVPRGMSAIHVGETSVARNVPLALPLVRYGSTELPNLNGFLIATVNRRTLVIRGATDEGTSHGIVSFLTRYVGVRQYWPGNPGGIGDVVPAHPTLRIPKLEWRDWPYVFSRSMSMRPFRPGRGNLLDFYRLQGTIRSNRNFNSWLPPDRYGQEHPEYFPLIRGVRKVPSRPNQGSRWQPCVSNPELRSTIADGVVAFFEEHPDAVGVGVAINDGGGDCTCDACQLMDAPGTDYQWLTGMSDRYVTLTNQVCSKVRTSFPDKLVVYLAYGAARHPPVLVVPDQMMLPVLTVPGNAFEAWDQWMATGVRHMGLYIHHDDLFFVLPKYDLPQAVKRLRYAIASQRMRVFYMEMHTQWPFNDVVPHVLAELLWDPRVDVDDLLDEYYTGFFGPAASAMREFHEALQSGYKRWLRREGLPHWHGLDVSSLRGSRKPSQFEVLNPEDAAQASDALAKAAKLSRSDPVVAKRVGIVRLMFRLQEMAVQRYWTAKRLRRSVVRSELEARRVLGDSRSLLDLGFEMKNYVLDVLEEPPASAYGLFRHSAKTTDLYEDIRKGVPPPEITAAIAVGVDAAAQFLQGAMPAEDAAAWWQGAHRDGDHQVLTDVINAAEIRSSGSPITNLISNSEFEDLGLELGAAGASRETEIVLNTSQERRLGIRQWFSQRSSHRVAVSKRTARSTPSSLMFENCVRARLSRHAKATSGEQFRVALSIKHNGGAAAYTFAVDVKFEDGSYQTLATLPVDHRKGVWHDLIADVVAPARARTIFLRMYIKAQAEDDRCWVDSLFIGRYPDRPDSSE